MPVAPISRNDPCRCGSGKKFKHCCINRSIFDRGKKARAIAGEGASLDAPYAQMDDDPTLPRFVVSIEYTVSDPLGVATISFSYPFGQLIQLEGGAIVPVQSLIPAMRFILEDNNVATVTEVRPPISRPDVRGRSANGGYACAVEGTFKYTGPVLMMRFTPRGGTPIEVTPGHAFWSVTRDEWYPIGSFVVGELLSTFQHGPVPIESIEPPSWRHTTVYNVGVAAFHSYFVKSGDMGICAHNGVGGAGCGVPKAKEVDPSSKLPPFAKGGKTTGVFITEAGETVLVSGRSGPAASMPKPSPGFNAITSTHVEGHAAATMRQQGIAEGTLYINNPEICLPCRQNLANMLPPGSRLTVMTPEGTATVFMGNAR